MKLWDLSGYSEKEEIKDSEPVEDNEKQDSEKQTEENVEEGRKDFQTS